MEQKQCERSAKNSIALITGGETEHLRGAAYICSKSRRAHMSSLCGEHVGCNCYHLRGRVYRFYKKIAMQLLSRVSTSQCGPRLICIVATNRTLHATSRRLRNICWEIVSHTNSHVIGVRTISEYVSFNQCKSHRGKKLRATSPIFLIVNVIDIFEIIVHSAVHAKQM